MKNEPLGQAARDANTDELRAAAPVPFCIAAFERVAYGSNIAEFLIETPLGIIDADLFASPDREPFVRPRPEPSETLLASEAHGDRALAALDQDGAS